MAKGDSDDLLKALGKTREGRSWRVWGAAALLLAAIAGLILVFADGGGGEFFYRTVQVRRGDLTVSVSATGTLQPVNEVEVGSELSGTIENVEADFNDRVEKGEILARLDTEILQAQLLEARASLQSAQAKVREAAATVTETRVDLKRCQDLFRREMCSESDLDKLRAAYQRAQASESMARAQLAMAQASLTANETNLRKAVIRSPISGIVLSRNVEPGQTVAASFQTPVLFTLAEDLTRMELLVAVDEADIGAVRLGQSATFTVDAYPDRSFFGKVTQIRQAPTSAEGVVTYETVLTVNNSDLALLPGMTATAEIKVNEVHGALLVPNSALRFVPEVAPESSTGGPMGLFPRPHLERKQPPEPSGSQRRVWVLRGAEPEAIPVKTGATNGQFTVIRQGEVKVGTSVIVEQVPRGQ